MVPRYTREDELSVMLELANVRDRLSADPTIIPSPLISSGSHQAAGHKPPQYPGRNAAIGCHGHLRALDTAWWAWLKAMRNPAIGRLRIYLDTVLYGASRPILYFEPAYGCATVLRLITTPYTSTTIHGQCISIISPLIWNGDGR